MNKFSNVPGYSLAELLVFTGGEFYKGESYSKNENTVFGTGP